MAKRALSMRKAKEILRLKHEVGLTHRQIARSCQVSHVTVGKYLERAAAAGVGWPLPAELDEAQLQELLRGAERPAEEAKRPLPAMAQVHRELRRPGVTLQLLWEEYRRAQPEGYAYTQFCAYYKRFRSQLEPSLRQTYKAGEKLFVDWAGQTIALVDPQTGQSRPAHLFVAVLGASNYTFAEAFENQQLPAWLQAHADAYAYCGGVPQLTVPDNTKTGVSRACRYEPDLNPSYQELAAHYGTVILPARAGEPTDKAKVETGVLQAEHRLLAALRDRRFFSLAELNQALRPLLEELNRRPFQKLAGSRQELFEQLDRPALRPLPAERYEPAEWRRAKVNIDYHVQVDWHLYSVPYPLVHREVEVRLTARTVELFHQGRRVAAHPRSAVRGAFTTDPAHRPKAHQQHLDWTPSRLIDWAGTVGPYCAQAVTHILETKPHPEQGYRACLGLLRLSRRYGPPRMEAACRRALERAVCSYRSIHSILATRLDQQAAAELPLLDAAALVHPNLRGAEYYH